MHNGSDPVLIMRDNQLKRIFKAAAILGFVLTLVSVWQKILFGWHPIIYLNLGAYAGVLAGHLLERRLAFGLRAALILAITLVLGVASLLIWGLMPVGVLSLFAFCILATLLFGVRCGIGATAISVAAMALIGGGVYFGRITFHFDANVYQLSSISWIQAIFGLIVSAGIIVVALGALHEQFVSMIHRLDAQNLQLVASNASLEKEIAQHARAEAERLSLQGRLRLARKMEALGLMSGSVAHDLNNVLVGVVSYPDLLLMQLPEGSPLKKSVATIKASGLKAAAMVQDMLSLARRGASDHKAVNLNGVIGDFMLSPELEKIKKHHPDIFVSFSLAGEPANIKGSSFHLFRILMNLVANAAEAMPEGGSLLIRTETKVIETPVEGFDTIAAGSYVVLSVKDSGTGIADGEIAKIFEPFYTKKKMGRSGTGLGMAVVWSVLKDHDGFIDVQSGPAQGTEFSLYFPTTNQAVAQAPTSSLTQYLGRGESILVVDDIQEMRHIACHMIDALGYKSESVPSGEAALQYLAENRVDLVILDMIMDPGMDGLDTYKQLIAMHPGQKAIAVSGFSETQRVAQMRRLGVGAYLKKPFLMEELAQTIRATLDGRHRG